jgi:hypothetical protein
MLATKGAISMKKRRFQTRVDDVAADIWHGLTTSGRVANLERSTGTPAAAAFAAAAPSSLITAATDSQGLAYIARHVIG